MEEVLAYSERTMNSKIVLGLITSRFAQLLFLIALLIPAGCGNGEENASVDGAISDASVIDASLPTDAELVDGGDAAPISDARAADATLVDALEEARTAPDGPTNIVLSGVWVTYIKPALGFDAAGFFVQTQQTGPALFIAVDPASLTPSPVVGDDIDLTITEMDTATSLRQATQVSGLVVNSSDNDVTTLTQDLSSAGDVVSAIAEYEAELVTLSGTISSSFTTAGSGHEAATIDTAGLSGDGDYRLRLPVSLAADLALHNGCTFTVSNTPMWRFAAVAQVSAWQLSEVSAANCSRPTLVVAVSGDVTEVRLEFSRAIDSASIVDAATQFTIDNGLAVTGAVVDSRFVTLTTSTQLQGTAYTVTVAASVQDILGEGVDAAANTASFSGYTVPAVVLINEIKANVPGGCDLLELRVTSAGSLEGFELLEQDTSVLTFGALMGNVDDYIVVHFDSNDSSCNPGVSGNEASTVNEQPAASFAQNFDTAYDWYTSDFGMFSTDNVITVVDRLGGIVDAVLVSDDPTGTAFPQAEAQAAIVAAAGQWTMVGGGIPPSGFVDDNFNLHAVQDLDGPDTLQRIDLTDNNTRNDWFAANRPASWGLQNSLTAEADFATVPYTATMQIDVAANDRASASPLNLASIVIGVSPSEGTLVVNLDGTVDYSHTGAEVASDSFTYTIDDTNGATSNFATVTINLVAATTMDQLVAGDLIISEFLQNADAVSDFRGEWFEIYNNTASPVDLTGMVVSDLGSNSFTVSGPIFAAAGDYILFVANGDPAENGNLPTPDYVYTQLAMTLGNSTDEIILENSTIIIDSILYDNGATFPDPNGASSQLNPSNLDALENDLGSNWCTGQTPYGDGDLGTPGAANDPCTP